MSLPIDLVLVRHGQSEGNAAARLSEQGDHDAHIALHSVRHSASFRLTDLGRKQAKMAGKFLREEFPSFDRYITSEYLRAIETSGELALPHASWFTDYYLTERDWGELEGLIEDERVARFADALKKRQSEPFFWRPPNGESFMDLCLRIDRVLDTLHRECSDKRVIITCHGEVMRAFQMRIERISQARFRELIFDPKDEERIFNCQIVHYSRRARGIGELTPHVGWARSIRPTEDPVRRIDWLPIKRSRYSNSDLLDIVHQTPILVP